MTWFEKDALQTVEIEFYHHHTPNDRDHRSMWWQSSKPWWLYSSLRNCVLTWLWNCLKSYTVMIQQNICYVIFQLGLTLLSSQYRARHWSPGFQACSIIWPLSDPLGPFPCPDLLLLLFGLFEGFFLGGCSLFGGHEKFGGLIGPVLLCSMSPFWKWVASPIMTRQSRGKPASWDVPEPTPLKLKFGGLLSLCRSKCSEFDRSFFPILLLLLRSSILSECLWFPFPSRSLTVELVGFGDGPLSLNPLLWGGPTMFPPTSTSLGLCWKDPPTSICCWDSLERVNVVGKDEGKLCSSRISRRSFWGLSEEPRGHLSWPFHCWEVVQFNCGSWPGLGKSVSLWKRGGRSFLCCLCSPYDFWDVSLDIKSELVKFALPSWCFWGAWFFGSENTNQKKRQAQFYTDRWPLHFSCLGPN